MYHHVDLITREIYECTRDRLLSAAGSGVTGSGRMSCVDTRYVIVRWIRTLTLRRALERLAFVRVSRVKLGLKLSLQQGEDLPSNRVSECPTAENSNASCRQLRQLVGGFSAGGQLGSPLMRAVASGDNRDGPTGMWSNGGWRRVQGCCRRVLTTAIVSRTSRCTLIVLLGRLQWPHTV